MQVVCRSHCAPASPFRIPLPASPFCITLLQVHADARDICNAMATKCDIELSWKDKGSNRSMRSNRDSKNNSLRQRVGLRRGAQSHKSLVTARSGYAFFISYYRAEAGGDARFLQAKLAETMRRPVFLDATDADVLGQILDTGLARSDALLFLQTAGALSRPWCLLELYEAARQRIPILMLYVEGKGYDYTAARQFLDELPSTLERANPGATAELRRHLQSRGLTFGGLHRTLASLVPSIISIQFRPDGTDSHVQAVLQDIVDKLERMRQHPPPLAHEQTASKDKLASDEASSPGGVPHSMAKLNFMSGLRTYRLVERWRRRGNNSRSLPPQAPGTPGRCATSTVEISEI